MVLTDITHPGMNILNASTSYGVADDIKKFPTQFLDALGLDADAEVCHTFLSVPGHPMRKGFIVASASMGDDTVIAPASGGGTIYDIISVKVDGVDARRKPVTYFKRLASDPLSRTQIGKYYDILDGNVIRHNGTSATAKLVRFAIGAAPQAPDEMRNACISCFLSMASSKMGADVQSASYFAQQWMIRSQMIKAGRIDIPPVIAYQNSDREG